MKWWILLGILCIIIFLTIYIYKRYWKPAVEGFQVVTYGPSADWNQYTISSDGKSFTIFDPEALYVQAQMFRYTLNVPYNKIATSEKSNLSYLISYIPEKKEMMYYYMGPLIWEWVATRLKKTSSITLAIFCMNLMYDIGNTNCTDECWSADTKIKEHGRLITNYYKKLEDMGISIKQRNRYHSECFGPNAECSQTNLYNFYIIGENTSPIVIAYFNDLISNFEREVLHENFEINPVGKFLGKIQSQIHRPCYIPLDLLPGPMTFTYPSVAGQGKEMVEEPYGVPLTDDNNNIFYPTPLSLTMDGTEKNPNQVESQKNVLLNPSEWHLVDLSPSSAVLSGRVGADSIRDEFLLKKGFLLTNVLSNNQLTGIGQENILKRTFHVNGTISNINMDEIRRSVFYTLHFNFSDTNNTKKQLLYTQTAPYRLLFSKNHKFENEMHIKNDYNLKQGIELTQDIVNIITYDAISFISSWGKTRRIGIMNGLINKVNSVDEKNRIQTEIKNDMIINTYNPSPQIYLFSYDNMSDKSYVQTTEEIQLTRTIGANAIIGNSELSITTTSIVYLTNPNEYNMINTAVEVFTIDKYKQKHSFTGATIKSFTLKTPYIGILVLDCSKVTSNSITDSIEYAFVDNGIPFPYTYTISFITPPKKIVNTLYTTDTQRMDILDALAQCFYDVNTINMDANSGIRITTIVDLYQVGNTIFDVRFRVSERDQLETANLLAQLSTLKSDYALYIEKQMTETERIQLDLNYNNKYQEILTNLQYAISGSSISNCGIYAQYIRIYAVNNGHMALSQVEVIDDMNQNAAIGANVTWGPYQAGGGLQYISAKIYPYEEPNQEMYGDGSNDPQIAQMNASGFILAEQQIKVKHLNSIVDGVRHARRDPNIYENDPSTDNNDKNFIEINLGYQVNIAYINLIFPKNITTYSSYTIVLKDSAYNDIANGRGITGAVSNNSASVVFSSTGINNYMTTTIVSISTNIITLLKPVPSWLTAGIHITIQTATIKVYEGLINKINGQELTLDSTPTIDTSTLYAISPKTNCPQPIKELYNPYQLGRFYADIKTTSAPGYLKVDKYYIKFTGYSGGEIGSPEADAVFTFNPMYNAGFVKPLTSAVGNINYQPTIKFMNPTELPDINCERDAKKIMHDYMMNITNNDFQLRNGTYYENGYNYFVSKITHYGDDVVPPTLENAKACKFRWNEQKVQAVTNKIVDIFDRTGTFVYIKSVYDWKVSADYYDTLHSFITNNDIANLTPFSPPIEMKIPTITEVNLDTLNERCPIKTCSDLDIIDSLVKQYNGANADTIMRVIKAVTPTPTQCEFECYTKTSENSTKYIRINININMNPVTYTCDYNYENGAIVTREINGTYIQPNTPLLTYVYNYTAELMRTFKQSVNNIYTNLSTMVQPHISQTDSDGLTSAIIKYRKDTWGAFGEIKELNTCSLSCNDPQVIYNFLNKYRNFLTRIVAIKGVGTFNSNTCDYMIDEATMSISGAGAFVEGSPRTAIYRATMDGCAVSNITNITDQNIASSILQVNRSNLDFIDLSGVIRSNHISFGDTHTFAVTATPTWMQGKEGTNMGTPVFIESASSYLEANVQSVSATSITFYNFFNARGPFNTFISAIGHTITDDVPSWLRNGIKVQILSDSTGSLVYDGTININNKTITLTGTSLETTANYNIFAYDTYTISNATSTEPSTAGSWSTPITLGTGLYLENNQLQVEAGNTSYNPGQPFRLVNKFFNTPATFLQKNMDVSIVPPSWLITGTPIIISTKTGGIQIYDGTIFSVSGKKITLSTFPSIEALLSNPSDSYNIFMKDDTAIVTGTIQSYSGMNLVLNIITGGPLLTRTSYTIQQVARPKSYPSIPRGFSPIDWIDCSSEFAKKSTGQTSLTQTGINTCGIFTFTRPAGSDTLKYNNITPTGLTAMNCPTRTTTLTNTIGYPVAENESLVSGSTYEYRVTTLDTLPFDQTYKRVTFYGNCEISAIQGANIGTSPNKNGAPGTAATTYADFFRHWWNIKYYYASKIQNKKVIGAIDGYYYDTNTDSLTFRCKSAEFGQNGPADILKYNESVSSFPTYAYYQVVFRRKYGKTGPLSIESTFSSIDNISSNYIIYSAETASASIFFSEITSSAVDTTTYTGMLNIDKSNYIVREPSLVLSNQFRFLRFQVTATNAADYAEIARIYFYKKLPDGSYDNSFKLNTMNTTFSAVSGQNITFTYSVPIWLIANINIKISSGNTELYSGNVKKVNGNQITLESSIAFSTTTQYTISYYNNNGSGIFLQSARFRMSNIPTNYYNYRNTDCSGGFLKIPNPYKTSYNICALATRSSSTLDPKYEYPKTGTCSIGYIDYKDSYQNTYIGINDTFYKTNMTTCITTGTYGEVNTILVNANSSTKRLRLEMDQYLWIDCGDLLTIDAYTFITGSASRLPISFTLQGSYNGTTWKILNTQTGFSYPTKSSFYVPGYFSTTGGPTSTLPIQPNFYISQITNTAFEGFENPVEKSPLLERCVDKTPYFKPDETALAPLYTLPLVNTMSANTLYQPLNTQARRIKTMKFHVLETYDPDAKFVHMSMFQFHTSVGPMSSSMVRISNPMGSRRSSNDSPERLLESTTNNRWVDNNKMPLIFTFIEYPQAKIIGFQFAFPDTPNQMAALPSRWKMEGSYDGRNWEIYHEKTEKAYYIGNASPIYKFKTEI
jgi:hypothetical protein